MTRKANVITNTPAGRRSSASSRRPTKLARASAVRKARAGTGTTTSTAPSRPGGLLDPEPGEVIVRMYQQGLGDCFLLSFPGTSGPCNVLIDCGVLLGTEQAGEKMGRVARSLMEATGGELEVLIATHEHWDHLSGFLQARDEFDKFTIRHLWLAWTEDSRNALANDLRHEREARKRSLRRAVARLRGLNRTRADEIDGVLSFFGGGFGATKSGTTEQALAYLKSRRDIAQSTRYCTPGGDRLTLPGAEDVRVYVLGPPQDRKKIKRSAPTKRGKEVYEFGMPAAQEASFFAAVEDNGRPSLQLSETEARRRKRGFPFDERYCITPAQARTTFRRFFDPHYGFSKKRTSGAAWRRIEDDWLQLASPLALKLDSDTNNTSLALAFELPKSRKVLLFPGDAQVGNWMSWHDYRWKDDDGGTIEAKDLLARTVLYKVGHHASHNATLRQFGLEMMTHPELVAMIPVNQDMAKRQRWNMPFPSLLNRLVQKTGGRILRADRNWRGRREPKPAGLSKARWDRFVRNVRAEKDLFVELTLTDD